MVKAAFKASWRMFLHMKFGSVVVFAAFSST